jgi:hypothetical protein
MMDDDGSTRELIKMKNQVVGMDYYYKAFTVCMYLLLLSIAVWAITIYIAPSPR